MKHVAFLRGMNVGGRRLTNVELCGHFEALGFTGVAAFLASGNVVFDAGRKRRVADRIETGLRRALGYDVPTFLRTTDQVVAMAQRDVFDRTSLTERGKEQVVLLGTEPAAPAKAAVLQLATEDDLLEFRGRELHWLPRGSVLQTGLDFRRIERLLGATTTRTMSTVQRLTNTHLAP